MSIKIKIASLFRRLVLPCAFAVPGVAACSGGSGSVPADAGPFIALVSDLKGFHGWQAYDAGNQVVDQIHNTDFRTVYIACTKQPGFDCHAPRHGQTSFDVGTMIVKESDPHDGGPPEIFAMAKRGGGFNDAGAADWEWFTLLDAGTAAEDNVQIVWRGDGPPQGSTYGASHESCNECHSLSVDNDFVASPPLQLTNF
jgi:hypothetical protein